jgi:hypothetical protein
MNEQLKDRIVRALEGIPDERGYQLLDYAEFLESKYAERANPSNVFTKLTDKAQDLMRAGKMPLDAISGTVGFFDGASKVMKGLANAAQSVVDEAAKTASSVTAPKPPSPDKPAPPSGPGATA